VEFKEAIMPRKGIAHETQHAFDLYANAYTVIAEPHRMSHDGFMFHASGKVTGLANAASADFLMVVPAGVYPHVQRVRLDVEAGEVDLVMYENVVTSDDGAAVTSFATNRNSANTPEALIYSAPTITDIGDLFHTRWVPPTGAGVGSSIGVVDVNVFGEEWLLAASNKYLFRITNNSGGVLDYAYEYVWYEIGEDAE
jgi:hypothetical protein